MLLRHICEVCGREELLDSDEAFDAGWDYPPRMGLFGIVSPRTCPDCLISETLWWGITAENLQFEDLSEKQRSSLERILAEPESING